MRRLVVVKLLTICLLNIATIEAEDFVRRDPLNPITFEKTDWPWWRGAARNGHATADQTPPLSWDEEKNVVWKAPVPGRGHGSPIVVGNRVFLATAELDTHVQSVICYDRSNGKQVWKTDLHTSVPPKKMNKKATMASSSPACDGERVFINFLHDGAVYTTALSLDGNQIWQTKITGSRHTPAKFMASWKKSRASTTFSFPW